jgi:ketosteroid isomerase-like protein
VVQTAPSPPPASNPAPAAAVPSRPTPPPAPAPAAAISDDAAIRAALDAFRSAYERLDVDAVRKVFPKSPANFSEVRSFEMQLSELQIALNGDRATVTARRFVRQTGKVGRPQEVTNRATFQMRRDGSAWIIDSIR